MTRYRTIVADPPWQVGDFPAWHDETKRSEREKEVGSNPTPYSTMTVEEIKALPIRDFAEADRWHVNGDRGGCNLFLWTTTQFLYDAYDVARAWGFKPTSVLVWCKEPMGAGLGGTFKSNVEFIVCGRRGSPPRATGSCGTRWFQWPRGRHSEKPDAFYDIVEQVSAGPYLEIFARRARFGWDYAGDGSLGTVEIPGLRAPGMEEAA